MARLIPGNRMFAFAIGALLFTCGADAARASVDILSPQAVENRFIIERNDKKFLLVGRVEWELVTNPRDPALSHLGDGSFHPMSPLLVREAVASLDRSGRALQGTILILPYPRRANLKSSCENGVIFLSPGIREVAPEHVHATTIHELGHLAQRTFAPEGSRNWEEYLQLRDLQRSPFAPDAEHKNRPREIFAEDFRALFGSPLAVSSGSIENPDLPYPTTVPGLREWFEKMLESPMSRAIEDTRSQPIAFPNPFRPSATTTIAFVDELPAAIDDLEFSAAETFASPLAAEVFDLAGRRVRVLPGEEPSHQATHRFLWDGRGEDGTPVTSGVYFVRLAGNPKAGTARVQVLR